MGKKIVPMYLLLALVYCLPQLILAQSHAYTFEQIDSLQKVDKRNVVVFIYTDWCRYCHAMKNTSFKNDKIKDLLKEQFWFAELNAEVNQEILFNGNKFKYKPSGINTGVHELAEQLGTIDGKLSYPALCILNADYEIIFQYNEFLSADDLKKILTKLVNKS